MSAVWNAWDFDGVPTTLVSSIMRAVRTSSAELPVDVAIGELRGVLAAKPMTRAQAQHLLTADALVTYDFETAANDPDTLSARATDAMVRIAALVEEPA